MQKSTGMEIIGWTPMLPQKSLFCSMLRVSTISEKESNGFWELSLCKMITNNSFFYCNKLDCTHIGGGGEWSREEALEHVFEYEWLHKQICLQDS